jgi:hypothetical protein
MVSNPAHWPWSGYKYFAFGDEDPLITPHPAYLGLSDDPSVRQKIYRDLVLTEMPYDNKEKDLFSLGRRGRPKKNTQTLEMSLASLKLLLQK